VQECGGSVGSVVASPMKYWKPPVGCRISRGAAQVSF
jgi:hypothetical protein